jgi:hypothetical protein
MNERTTNKQTTKDDEAGVMITTTITMLMTTMTKYTTKTNCNIFLPSRTEPTTHAVEGITPNQAHASSPMVWG